MYSIPSNPFGVIFFFIRLNNGPNISDALIHFSLFFHISFSAVTFLKRDSQLPYQQGLPFIICGIHCSPVFSFIALTISRESRWHYATCCNTITSLSHFSVVVKAGTVFSSTVIQQIQIPSLERDTLWLLSLLPTTKSHCGCLAICNYFMPLGSARTGQHSIVLEKNDDWQPASIPQELIRLPD